MIIRLRRRLHVLLQRPSGRLASLLLAIAVIAAGIPAGQLHAHVDGDGAHEHITHVVDNAQVAQQGDADLQSPADIEVLHAHDACSAVYALPSVLAVVRSMDGVVAVSELAPVATAPLTPRIPPHRPPIA